MTRDNLLNLCRLYVGDARGAFTHEEQLALARGFLDQSLSLESVRAEALKEAAEACENHAIHVSNTEDAYAACVNCARDIRALSLESVREEALEEAAKVCDADPFNAGWRHAAAIRALSPARMAEGDEYGWLIERFVNGHHEWFAGWNDDSHGFVPKSPKWTHDAFQAVRFSRKQDGERVANYDANFMHTKVIEHGFMPPESPAKEQPK